MNLKLQFLSRVLLLIGALFLVACQSTKTESASVTVNKPSFFNKKNAPSVDEVCTTPSFQSVKLNSSVPSYLLSPPSGSYKIGPGDELDIEVAEDTETRATVRVLPDGMLYYNVANGVNVKGKTIREVSKILADDLSYDYVEPIITVNIANSDSQRYWVLGGVENPGTFPIQRPTTLIAALSQSQGLALGEVNNESEENVDLANAILIRNNKRIPVNFKALIQEGDMSQNVYVQPNDYIFLPSRTQSNVYVLGQANNPGPVTHNGDTTLLSAIASAGGPDEEAVITKVMIIRGRSSQPEVSVVNLPNLMRGQTPNLRLEPGDVVWLPRSPWTNVRDYTETVLTTAAQAIAVQEGLGAFGAEGSTGVTITAGGF